MFFRNTLPLHFRRRLVTPWKGFCRYYSHAHIPFLRIVYHKTLMLASANFIKGWISLKKHATAWFLFAILPHTSVCLLPPMTKGKQAKKPRWGFFVKRVTENVRNEVRLCRALILNIFLGRARVAFSQKNDGGIVPQKCTFAPMRSRCCRIGI